MALRIHQSTSAAHAQQYYTAALDRADYYAQDGHSPGEWWGRGAAKLGLAGAVTKAAFFAVTENKRPDAPGTRLTASDKGEARRAGYDLTFSTPKEVSALWALTGDQRIERAFRESVEETLAEIEQDWTDTRLRRNGSQGLKPTGNLVASLFTHATTRPLADGKPDPHLHLHAFIHNATFAEHEDRWQAIELSRLHYARPYIEAAFESRLARKLHQDVGYPIERTAGGWTVAGFPQETARTLSRRTAEIEAKAEDLGIVDPAAKGRLGAKTRRGKGEGEAAASETLRRYWEGKLTPAEREAIHALRDSATGGSPITGPSAGVALAHARDHLFARNSAVPVATLLAETLKYGAGAVTPGAAKAALMASPEILTRRFGGQDYATTRTAIDQEKGLIAFARNGRGKADPLQGYTPHAFRREFLNAGQRQAVTKLLSSFDRVQILTGKAGTGKSTALSELRDGIEAGGRQVLAVAPTTGAAGVLAADGFASATIARLLADDRLQGTLKGGVLLVDEAGLVGVPTMKALFDLAEKEGARVILVGDSGQHHSPERGQALKLLEARAGLPRVALDEILRQEGSLKDAVSLLARGVAAGGFEQLQALGAVREIRDESERYERLAEAFADTLDAGKEALAVSPTHAEGAKVEAAIRAELKARERISGEERAFTRLENTQLTEAERSDAVHYRPGDVIRFHQNATGWTRGAQATVIGREGKGVRVRDSSGRERELTLALAPRFQLFRPRTMPLAKGDRIRFTLNAQTPEKKRLISGATATVKGFTKGGDVLLEGGTVIPKEHGHIAPAWVSTSVAAQGKTVSGKVFLAQSAESLPAASAQQFYVSVSRAKGGPGSVAVFTDDAEQLKAAVTREERPKSALELAEESARTATAAIADRLRRLRYLAKLYALRGLEYARGMAASPNPILHQGARA